MKKNVWIIALFVFIMSASIAAALAPTAILTEVETNYDKEKDKPAKKVQKHTAGTSGSPESKAAVQSCCAKKSRAALIAAEPAPVRK